MGAPAVGGSLHIGDKKKECHNCGNIISSVNKSLKCSICNSRFCEDCEGWFRTAKRSRGESPSCKKHYLEEKELSERDIRERLRTEMLQKEFTNSIGMKFVKIAGKSYYMGKYQVTQNVWKAIMSSDTSYFKGNNLPVERVSWNDCQNFIEKLNNKEGTYKYRLPTENEWEHACRAGSKTKYCFGDDVRHLGKYAWYHDNSRNKTHVVGAKRPNKWGLHDMHGNVWEWCYDKYDDTGSRVIRGGSWNYAPNGCESASRLGRRPDSRYSLIGVRLVRSSD